MKILFLAHRIPFPPNKGDKIRSYNALRRIAARHEVIALSFHDRPEDVRGLENVRDLSPRAESFPLGTWGSRLRAALALLGGTPLSTAWFHSRAFRAAVRRELAAGVDAIYVFSSAMARFLPASGGAPAVVDYVDLDSAKWRLYSREAAPLLRPIYGLEARRLAAWEDRVAARVHRVVLATEEEAAELRPRVGAEKVLVAQNGVDLERFPWRDATERRPAIVMTGAMDYFPNADGARHFLDAIWPLVRREEPGAEFWIVGREPPRDLVRRADGHGVLVTGAVPEIQPYVWQAACAVAPLRLARGIQNKILEAMALGTPAVATTAAATGLRAGPEDGLVVVDEPEAFAREVVRLLREPGTRADRARRARAAVEERYSWERNLAPMVDALEEAAG